MLRDHNLPILDRACSALVEDLDVRGLLESTLVVVMGEMGRSPRVNAAAGRDHWPQCGFSLLTGGGVREGTIWGSSDRIAAYPRDNPASPAALGRPEGLLRVGVYPLWDDHYRINILVGGDAATATWAAAVFSGAGAVLRLCWILSGQRPHHRPVRLHQ